MNTIYSFHNNLVLRTPRIPLVKNIDASIVSLLLNEKSFLEALYLASPVLYDECLKWQQGLIANVKDIHKIERSIIKYYSRMSSRCTPFGLFSGCAKVEWNDTTNIIINSKNIKRHTRFDMHYLCALSQRLALLPCIKEKLLYFPNNSIYALGDEIRYVEYKYKNGKRNHQISSVTSSHYLNQVLCAATNGITIREIVIELENEEITKEESRNFIDELISSQLLVSDLEPSITGTEFFFQIIAILKKINTDCDNTIQHIIDILEQANQLLQQLDSPITNDASQYRQVINLIDNLNTPLEENKLFQVDMAKIINQGTINKSIQKQVQESLEVLNKLTPAIENENMQLFAKRFYNRYEDKEMPLVEVMDTETGIGYQENGVDDSPLVEDIVIAGKTIDQKIAWGKLEDLLQKKILEAYKHDHYSIEITSKDLESFNSNWNDLPPSLSVIFRMIDGENGTIYLESASGSSAANLLGRFAYADPEISKIVCDVTQAEQRNDPEIVYAEIIHLPDDRTGNILLHPAFRDYEIPYMAQSSLKAKHQIDIKDLFVSVKNNHVVLRSKKLGRQIIPRLSTTHNYFYNALPLYQFLCDLQTQGIRNGLQFNWGSLQAQYKFLPRVAFNNTILYLATWQFLKNDCHHLMQLSNADLKKAIDDFRSKWKLPRYAVLAEGDNELLIDFENDLLVQIWIEAIKNKHYFIIKEFLCNENGKITDEFNQSYSNQLVAILMKNTNSYETVKNFPEQNHVNRKFSPGSEWVYYKLYCGAKSSEKILIEAVKPLAEELLNDELIDKWFFIRYTDPDFHLRLRFHVNNLNGIGETIRRVHHYLSPFERYGYIWKLQMDTYNREIERYGGNSIELAETFFYHDSTCLLKMLDKTCGDEREQVRWLWGLRSVDELLNCFEFRIHNKLVLLTHLKDMLAAEFKTDKILKTQLNDKYRNNREMIELIMNSEKDKQSEFYPLILILYEKSAQIKMVADEILDLQRNQQSQISLTELVSSFIHMLLNRVYTSNHRLHEFISYDFLFRYYKSAAIRQNKAIKDVSELQEIN